MTDVNKVILVVEDEEPLLKAIKLKLKKNNFDVVTARSTKQAEDYIKDLPHIDAIWLDHYLLGKENGLDFVGWCKNEENIKCKGKPIFVVSNTASNDKIATYLSLGVEKYLVKSNHRLDELVEDVKKSIHS
jgi:DNA-binding response OmpR family regulator